MIDHANLRANPQQVKDSQRYRGESVELVDDVIALDEKRRAAINRADQLRAEHKKMSKTISGCPPEERAELVAKASSLADEVKKAQDEERDLSEQFDRLASQISNIIDPEAPIGGEDDYVVLKTVGEPQVPDHIVNGDQIHDHLSIATKLGLLDMDRGAKVGGARFYFLTGYGALLENALMQLGLSYAVKHDFIPIIPPVLVKPEIMQGTGFLGHHSAEVYQVTEDNLYLVGTSEVALAGMHQGEILDLSSGPLRYAGISTCFRREAGSYGKDTRGIIRVHQFNKVEMFIYCSPEDAVSEHNRLLNIEEELLSALQLPYRVIDIASGDLGSSATRKYDVEAWVPSQNTYRELTSTSNCTTFQARRLGIRYRDENNKTQYAATLNGTLATTRWLVAIIENYYQPDGSIRIPEVLVPFMGGITEIKP